MSTDARGQGEPTVPSTGKSTVIYIYIYHIAKRQRGGYLSLFTLVWLDGKRNEPQDASTMIGPVPNSVVRARAGVSAVHCSRARDSADSPGWCVLGGRTYPRSAKRIDRRGHDSPSKLTPLLQNSVRPWESLVLAAHTRPPTHPPTHLYGGLNAPRSEPS